MNLSKVLGEIDVNVSIFDKPQELMCFALVLCCAAYTFDGSQSETYLNLLCYRHEVETSQGKAASCHFWHLPGFMGNISRTIFFPGVWDTSTPSSAKAILTVDMNQHLSSGWKAHSVVLLPLPCLHSYSADGKRRMSSGGSSWHDGDDVKVGAGVLLACLNRDQVK